MIINDEAYMRMALQLAEPAQGQTGTNPVVGCVIVKDGRIIGIGSHLKMGEAHAEVHALQMAGSEATGSTVYVTLEPCSHVGKTPPCAAQLAAANVKRVVIACVDPNEQVAGAGIAILQQHGIEVEVGICREEAQALNEVFFKFITTKLPFVTLKTASTLDGKIASKTGDSKWISNEASRRYVHTLRHRHQAIMVGVGTVLADDPELSTRLDVPGLQPHRLIVDSQLRTPPTARVIRTIRTSGQATTLLTTDSAPLEKQHTLEEAGAEVVRCGAGPRVDLTSALHQLAERGIGSILLEGGAALNGAMLEAQLIDKVILFFAPKIIGGGAEAPANFHFSGMEKMAEAIALERVDIQSFADDVCIIGYPRYGGGKQHVYGNH